MYNRQYFESVLNTIKAVAFHEIYMESLREDLCVQQFYDPLTAYRALDSFHHNQVSAYEIRSFLQLEGNYIVTNEQCQQVVQSLNKKLTALSYDDFQQLSLPIDNIALRNRSLARYKNLKPQVGVMGTIQRVKDVSRRKITEFIFKQIEFNRELILRKREFCVKYGGDLYTLAQTLCKGLNKQQKKEDKNIEIGRQFYLKELIVLGRQYKLYFNLQELRAIYRRTKGKSENIMEVIARQGQNESELRAYQHIKITIQALSSLLLAKSKQLDIKKRIQIIGGVSISDVPIPSYKTPIFQRHETEKITEQLKKKKQFIENEKKRKLNPDHGLKYQYYYPERQMFPYHHRRDLRQQANLWTEEVHKMSGSVINLRYEAIDRKKYFL